LAQVIKKKNRYKRLDTQSTQKKNNQNQADVIVFAQTPQQLAQLLESLEKNVTNIKNIFVMYRPLSPDEIDIYDTIKQSYPYIEFYLITDHRANFKETLYAIYQKCSNDYILFSKSETYFNQYISLSQCIDALEKTSAQAFYFKLNAHEGALDYQTLPLIKYTDDIYAWNFALARDKWTCANSLDLVLHKKNESLNHVLQSNYDLTPQGLEAVWANEGNLDHLGLCFKETTVISPTRKG
jgi:hypothetical protein